MSSNIFAAAVFIYKDGEVLATKRADNGMYGLPCGKVEVDEPIPYTAIRECFEETGYVTFIYLPSAYAGLDDSGHIVKTYRGEIVARGVPTHPEEGETVWITPKQLVEESAWGEYNRAVLDHFGVDWE